MRGFAVWLQAEDRRHEVPPRDAFGRAASRRPAPHLLTCAQIERLMEAALRLDDITADGLVIRATKFRKNVDQIEMLSWDRKGL